MRCYYHYLDKQALPTGVPTVQVSDDAHGRARDDGPLCDQSRTRSRDASSADFEGQGEGGTGNLFLGAYLRASGNLPSGSDAMYAWYLLQYIVLAMQLLPMQAGIRPTLPICLLSVRFNLRRLYAWEVRAV